MEEKKKKKKKKLEEELERKKTNPKIVDGDCRSVFQWN